MVKKATDARKVLLISDSFDENTFKSARNVKTTSSRHRHRCEHRAIARVRQNFSDAGGAGETGRKDQREMNDSLRYHPHRLADRKIDVVEREAQQVRFPGQSRARTRFRSSTRSSAFSRRRSSTSIPAIMPAKKARVAVRYGRKPQWKKAIVTLKEGDKIELV